MTRVFAAHSRHALHPLPPAPRVFPIHHPAREKILPSWSGGTKAEKINLYFTSLPCVHLSDGSFDSGNAHGLKTFREIVVRQRRDQPSA